ncbi:MAG: O-antigen ligase family protein [Lawsonibacter sp.]
MSKKRIRRNTQALPTMPIQSHQPEITHSGTRWSTVLWALVYLSFFLFCHFMNTRYIQGISLLAGLLALVAVLLRTRILVERLSWPVVFLILFVCMQGISTLYTVSGSLALQEFLTLWCSFCVFLAILMFAKGDSTTLGRRSATLLEFCAALTSLISIDLISTRVISTLFLGFMSLFEPAFSSLNGLEEGVRITSILGNPNIFAGCVGIGVFLSLGLATSETEPKKRFFHLVCLAWNALGFVLAFSMGATGMIVPAFLVYLLLEQQARRSALLLLMIETLVLTLVATFPIYLTSFQTWSGFQPIPLCAGILVSIGLCLSDKHLTYRLLPFLSANKKRTAVACTGVAAGVLIYAVLSLNLTGSITLDAGETIRRSAYPDSGHYTLQIESSAPLAVEIQSQTKQQAMVHTNSVLYSGPAQDAQFEVPEGSLVVYFNFTAETDTVFSSAHFQHETGLTKDLKLGYPLLPGFVANRMQGFFANENAIQRTVFFQDGLKLFLRSPIFGLGMGAFENSYTSVQSFNYTTKYVHNHYIQVLLETGLIGFFFFVGLLLTSAIAILITRRKGDAASPLIPCLGAALIFMAGHAAVEVVFSSNVYLPLAFGIFSLIALCCGNSLSLPSHSQRIHKLFFRILAAFMGIYSILLTGSLVSGVTLAQAPSYQNYALAITWDRFHRCDYMLAYVVNAYSSPDTPESVMEQAKEYAKKLETTESSTTCYYLASVYFSAGETEQAMHMLKRYVSLAASRSSTWTNAFSLLTNNLTDDNSFQEDIAEIYQGFQTWNEKNLGSLQVDESLLNQVESLLE